VIVGICLNYANKYGYKRYNYRDFRKKIVEIGGNIINGLNY
jgi:hypothetical protein